VGLLPLLRERNGGDRNTPKPCTEPPYSVGQESSANDGNANVVYPTLDGRITATYAEGSTAKSTRVIRENSDSVHSGWTAVPDTEVQTLRFLPR
jgi:hypothetical protein